MFLVVTFSSSKTWVPENRFFNLGELGPENKNPALINRNIVLL